MPPLAELKRQFVWTTIPAGRVDAIEGEQAARFSVLLTPRLIGPAGATLTLDDFGMQAWPRRLAAATFKAFRGSREIAARRIALATLDGGTLTFSVAEQLSAWEALFPHGLRVRPYQPTSYGQRRVREFPASEAGAQIRDAYGGSAQALALHASANVRPAEVSSALQRITARWQAGLWEDTGANAAGRTAPPALRQAYDFYQRSDPAEFTPRRLAAGAESPALDFHDIVARLADHPVLLRALGLLVDFAAPVGALTGDSDTDTEIHTTPSWPDPDTDRPVGWENAAHEDVSPRTSYTLLGSRFLPSVTTAAPGIPSSAGLLPLQGTDVEGRGTNPRFEIAPFDIDGAALRMVSAAAAGREQQPRPVAEETPELPTLRSMGFSLVEKTRRAEHDARLRRAEHRSTVDGLLESALSAGNLLGGYRIDIFDEKSGQWRSTCQRRVHYSVGGVQIGFGTGTAPAGLLEEGYLRPDSVTTGDGAADTFYVHQIVARWDGWSAVVARPERVADAIVVPPWPFKVRVDVQPGSLPRLRFGRTYRLRARLADLAGGGLQSSQVQPNEHVSERLTHWRFEPVSPPEFAPTRAYADGEGEDQLVIRSDRGVTAEEYAALQGYRPFDLRYLFAPKSSLELALQHADAFDATLGPQATDDQIRTAFAVAKRADLDFKDIPEASLVPGANGSGDYFLLPETPVTLPWLPDRASNRMSVIVRFRPVDPTTGTPGTTQGFVDERGEPKSYVWRGDWPDHSPVGLRVSAGSSGCTAKMVTDENGRTFVVALGPAEQATLDIVSCPSIDDVTLLGIANWAGVTATPSHPINQHVYRGKNPMVTPRRTLTVIHAVQRPLVDPSGQFVPKRHEGDMHVVLDPFRLAVHVPSTGRIDVRGEWTDFEDVPPAAPTHKPRFATVGSYDVEHEPLYLLSEIRQEFGDTRRRRVKYSVTAISRFHDYFGRLLSANSGACTVEGTLEVTDVPSSVRPPAPKLRYVMPAFRWTREGEGTALVRSRREGGGLRLFLERPWFVSGEDEALAAIAWPAGASPPGAALKHLSLAGKDPIWDTSHPDGVLNAGHFNAAESVTEFLLESGGTVSAVVHPVHFDAEADCWCADVQLIPLVEASYFPFVRLGLARYQANTVNAMHRLSPPILSEPIQILPTRDLAVRRSPGHALVTVSGRVPGSSRSTTIRAELQVIEGGGQNADDVLIGSSGWRTIAQKSGLVGNSLDLDVPEAGTRRMRILVTEEESYPADGPPTDPVPSRVVYADSVPL